MAGFTGVIRVIENIGSISECTFGVPGTEIDVYDGVFLDLTDFKWDNDFKPFENIDEINKMFSENDIWKTEFELAEEYT